MFTGVHNLEAIKKTLGQWIEENKRRYPKKTSELVDDTIKLLGRMDIVRYVKFWNMLPRGLKDRFLVDRAQLRWYPRDLVPFRAPPSQSQNSVGGGAGASVSKLADGTLNDASGNLTSMFELTLMFV